MKYNGLKNDFHKILTNVLLDISNNIFEQESDQDEEEEDSVLNSAKITSYIDTVIDYFS